MDMKAEQTDCIYDMGAVRLKLEEVFLSELDGDAIVKVVSEKIGKGQKLSHQEIMKLAMLPLTYRGKKKKKEMIRNTFELVKDIEDEETQKFILSGLMVFTDKIISRKDYEDIRSWITMTKIGKMFEEEKQRAVEMEKQEKFVLAEEFAKTLIEQGMDTAQIVMKVKVLNEDQVDALR